MRMRPRMWNRAKGSLSKQRGERRKHEVPLSRVASNVRQNRDASTSGPRTLRIGEWARHDGVEVREKAERSSTGQASDRERSS
jgi:hypothetical protein